MECPKRFIRIQMKPAFEGCTEPSAQNISIQDIIDLIRPIMSHHTIHRITEEYSLRTDDGTIDRSNNRFIMIYYRGRQDDFTHADIISAIRAKYGRDIVSITMRIDDDELSAMYEAKAKKCQRKIYF